MHIFSRRLLHASFGGGNARRMFTMNLGRRAKTSMEIDNLISYGDTHFYGFGLRKPHGKAMLENAPQTRMKHLTPRPLFLGRQRRASHGAHRQLIG